MTKKQKNWLISLSAIVLASGVAIGVALPLTMCSPAPTPGPGPTPIEKMELKSVGNYGANATTDQDHPIVYIKKDQNVDDANVLRFMEIEVGSNLENTYGCTGWTASGQKIETNNTWDSSFDIDISANTIPKTVLVDGNEKNIKNIGYFRGNGITSLVIPNFIEIIGKSAFYDCSGLTSLDLSGATSLQTIDISAFASCSGLTAPLTIPANVTSIGQFAFLDCTSLNSLDLSGATSLQTIDAYAFGNCPGLTGTLTIPASVTSIGQNAFRSCSGLTSLDLSNATSLQTINNEAFAECSKLTGTLTIPASVTSIGANAFKNCKFVSIDLEPGNTKYSKATNLGANCDVVLDITSNGIFNNNSKTIGCLACGQLEIPDTATSIDVGAFASCSGLASLDLSGATSLQTIGDGAFGDCSGLTGTLTIPASVISIGSQAFAGCKFTLIDVEPGNTKYSKATNLGANCHAVLDISSNGIFDNNSKIIGGLAYGQLELPNNLTSIGNSAFYNCSGLTGLNLSGATSLQTIDNNAFSGCTGLTGAITIPASVTSIGDGAFENCTGLTDTLTIPASVTLIGIYAFQNCTGLTSLDLSGATSLQTIGENAFYNCSNLTGSLTIPNSVSFIGSNAFQATNFDEVNFQQENPLLISNNVDVFAKLTGSNDKIIIYVPVAGLSSWQNTSNIITSLGISNTNQIRSK